MNARTEARIRQSLEHYATTKLAERLDQEFLPPANPARPSESTRSLLGRTDPAPSSPGSRRPPSSP